MKLTQNWPKSNAIIIFFYYRTTVTTWRFVGMDNGEINNDQFIGCFADI